jgi:hypothetical protein
MLNETWRLWQALENAKIEIDIPHPLINPLPVSEKNLLRVRLDEGGHVVSVEDIADDEFSGIRRIIQTSDGSFPVIKVNQPLLDLPAKSAIWINLNETHKKIEQIDLLDKSISDGTPRSWTEAGWNWTSSLEKANLLLEKLSNNEKGRCMAYLAKRFQKALQSKDAFILELCKVALSQLRTGHLDSIKTVRELLVGKGKEKDGKDRKISVLLVLELVKEESVYRNQVWQSVASVLPTNLSSTQREHQHRSSASAFGGKGDLLKEPFPGVKLPILNKFPLISMASDGDKAKCNRRYGLTEYTVCPVTSPQSRQMHGALQWLLSRDEGTTWRGVASGKFEMDSRTRKKKEKRDLLLVYVDAKPELDAKTASLFGSGSDITEAQFEIDAKAVCDALNGVVQEHPKSRLNLFLIRKVSDGQAQVALAEFPIVKNVIFSAERWQQAVRQNLPKITLYLQSGQASNKNEVPEIIDAYPIVPYPDQVVRLLSYQWIRDGSSPIGANGKAQKAKQEVVCSSLGDVLALMLRIEGKWKPIASKLLNLLLQRVTPLLIGVFGAKHAYGPRYAQGKHEPLFDYPRDSRKAALQAVAVIGILLDALESRKEKFMKNAPYLVGQVLALADTLHKDYCIVVRKGQLPNSLIGTSLMRRALDSPIGALADLSERMMEYVRWAKVAQISHDWSNEDQRTIAVKEAKKKLRQYQFLAESLAACDLPVECDNLMKAQLLLGFLASPPADEQND